MACVSIRHGFRDPLSDSPAMFPSENKYVTGRLHASRYQSATMQPVADEKQKVDQRPRDTKGLALLSEFTKIIFFMVLCLLSFDFPIIKYLAFLCVVVSGRMRFVPEDCF